MEWNPQRDLIGYGGRPPEIVWPNGSRLAVNIALNLEEGAEFQIGDGDPRSEKVGEFASVVPDHLRDRGQEQFFGYGVRTGAWRMLDALDAAGIKATVWMCGRAAARHPALAAEFARRGHEVACHGWTWRTNASYGSRAEEAADLDRAVAAIETATGKSPAGFYCRGSDSDWTRSLIAERGFCYTSNAYDDDLPYRDPASGLVVLPYSLDTNDARFSHPNGFVRAEDMIAYCSDALDVLLAEAEDGKSAVLTLGFHLRICGRPGRFKAFREMLNRVAGQRDRLWIATRDDIAAAFQASEPSAPGATRARCPS